MSDPREYPAQPVVAVGGVAIADGRVALVRRAHEPRRGEWSIPGGKLEAGETLAAGVRRELREETGLEVEVVSPIEVFERIYRDPDGRLRFHYVILDYFCRPSSGDAVAGGDALEVAWVREEELDGWPLNEAVVRVVRKGFALSRQALPPGAAP